ncbi:MAG: hypothetical protein JJT75_11655 [Opitutales bacterium]|nr:hypothetical protein [Opitutales bacterium]MCH8540006.1 MFS transporter [Opitutales bacterium]
MFRILPGESGKVMAFVLLALLLQAGMMVGIATADALFLAELGARKLPIVYLILPLVTILYAPIYSVLTNRLGINRLFVFTLCLLVLGGVFFGLAFTLFAPLSEIWFYAVKLYTGLWFVALYTLLWNFTDDYFAVSDGKRLFGVIAAGSSLGGIIGAGLVSGLAGLIAPGYLFYAWSFFAFVSIPVFVLATRFTKLEFGYLDEEESPSSWEILGIVGKSIRRSRYALCLALICFILVYLGALLEFLTFGVLEQGRDAAELASLLGVLYGVAAALTLLINLFLFSRIVGLIGVGNTALIVPIAFLMAFVLFYLEAGILAALAGFYVLQTLFVAVEYTNMNLLFNGLSNRVRKHLRTFIEALAEPLAMAMGGLFLLFFAQHYGIDEVAFVGMMIGLIAIIVALFIRSDYGPTLANNLREDWLDLSLSENSLADKFADEDREDLFRRAMEGPSEDRLLAVELLWRLNDERAREALLSYLEIAAAKDVDRLSPIINGLLGNCDNVTLAEILLWLESRSGDCPPEILGEFLAFGAIPEGQVEEWKKSSDPAFRALLAVARWHNSHLDETEQALADIQAMLKEDDVSRQWALRAIGDLRHPPLAGELLVWISHSDALLRRQALEGLVKLAPGMLTLPQEVLARLPKATPEELPHLLKIVAAVGDTASAAAVLRVAPGIPVAANQTLVKSLVTMGAKASPGVVSVLRDRTNAFRSRLLAARVLAQIAATLFQEMVEELIETELERSTPRNSNDKLDFILELLSLRGSLPDLDLIRSSLRRTNIKDRANAVETMEQYIPHKLFVRLETLLEVNTAYPAEL